MTSRERVLLALNHKDGPLPVDFGGLHSSIHRKAYNGVMDALGWGGGETRVQDWFQLIVFPDERLLSKFGTDCAPLYANPGGSWSLKFTQDENFEYFVNEWGIKLRKPKDGYFFDLYEVPLRKMETVADMKKYKWPDPEDPARIKGLKERARMLRETTDKAIVLYNPIGGPHEHSYFLRGLDELLLDLALNPDISDYLAGAVAEWEEAFFTFVLKEVGSYVDVAQIGDDLGSSTGLLFSREMWHRYYKKRERKIIDAIKKHSNAAIYFHCCGAVREMIPDLINNGVEILNPVQLHAAGMDSAGLKKDFGRDLTFWGAGCNPQVLTAGTVDEVRKDAKRRIEDLHGGGGFVFASVHNVQANDPPANIIAMYETAAEYR
jgi:uroporphyrinogen decarboxylase